MRRTTVSIKAILNQQYSELAEALGKIDTALAGIVAAMGGFSDLATSIHPGDSLSDQAKGILVGLNAYETGKMLVYKSHSGYRLVPLGRNVGRGASLSVTEQRFLEDDLRRLVDLGFLSKQKGPKDSSYTVTRAGDKLASELSEALSEVYPPDTVINTYNYHYSLSPPTRSDSFGQNCVVSTISLAMSWCCFDS